MGTRRPRSACGRILVCLFALVLAVGALDAAGEPSSRMLSKRRHASKAKVKAKSAGKASKSPKGGHGLPDSLQELFDNIDSRHCYKGVQLDRNPHGCACTSIRSAPTRCRH